MSVISSPNREENNVDPDNVASEKPTGLDIDGFQNRIYVRVYRTIIYGSCGVFQERWHI